MSAHGNDPSEPAEETIDLSKLPMKKSEGSAYESPVEVQVTQLMGRTKAGEQAAFDELVQVLRGRAFRQARSLVGSHEDAMDLCQEAFLKTYRSRDSYREDQAFMPWFHRILRNTCFSFLRKKKRITTHSLSGDSTEDDAEWILPDDGPAPSAKVEAEERNDAFWTAFAVLSENDREILNLRHFEELSYREISRTLEIPEGTVMSRLYHARRRLREELSSSRPEQDFFASNEPT